MIDSALRCLEDNWPPPPAACSLVQRQQQLAASSSSSSSSSSGAQRQQQQPADPSSFGGRGQGPEEVRGQRPTGKKSPAAQGGEVGVLKNETRQQPGQQTHQRASGRTQRLGHRQPRGAGRKRTAAPRRCFALQTKQIWLYSLAASPQRCPQDENASLRCNAHPSLISSM
jgi:hypothetical protein